MAMSIYFEHHDQWYRCELETAKSIAIELNFNGDQPNHFGADIASSQPLRAGQFIGDTTQGGSCNVSQINLIPHCNGTHTETIHHIVDHPVPVGQAAMESLMLGLLITVTPTKADQTDETYRPPLDQEDSIITSAAIQAAVNRYGISQPTALIVRTLPNSSDKRTRQYNDQNVPPFFTIEAMNAILNLGITHLLVDFPSIDRMYDEGKLTNHHLFWNVPENTHQLTEDSHTERTITEMVFVDDSIADGLVLLNLQIPAFQSDAAPSRPVVWPVVEVSGLGDN